MSKSKGNSGGNQTIRSAAKTLGHAGGKVGGPARAKALSPGRRSEIAAEGARAANRKGKIRRDR